MTHDRTSHKQGLKKILVADVGRALLNAPVRSKVFVELHPDAEVEGEDMVGELTRSPHGTHQLIGTDTLQNIRKELGLVTGRNNASVFCRHDSGTVACEEDLRWLEKKYHLKYDIASNTVGLGTGDIKTGPGVEQITDDKGVMYESDPRHAGLMIVFMGLTGANQCYRQV